jgi:hypothetical protein
MQIVKMIFIKEMMERLSREKDIRGRRVISLEMAQHFYIRRNYEMQ